MVPTTATVRAGARVAIVLKADQRSGRLTQGVVSTLLTRGNHPRGIKVRLADGQVGRVQRVLEGDGSSSGNNNDSGGGVAQSNRAGLEPDREAMAATTRAAPTPRHHYRHQRDVRLDEDLLTQDHQVQHELADFIKPARKKKGAATKKIESNEALSAGEQLAKCPVCGEFEGDEAAVAHHVEAHFTEAPCA